MTNGDGIALGVLILGIFSTIIAIIVKRQPKMSPAFEELLRSIKEILISNNEMTSGMTAIVNASNKTADSTHQKLNDIIPVIKTSEETLHNVEVKVLDIWKKTA